MQVKVFLYWYKNFKKYWYAKYQKLFHYNQIASDVLLPPLCDKSSQQPDFGLTTFTQGSALCKGGETKIRLLRAFEGWKLGILNVNASACLSICHHGKSLSNLEADEKQSLMPFWYLNCQHNQTIATFKKKKTSIERKQFFTTAKKVLKSLKYTEWK